MKYRKIIVIIGITLVIGLAVFFTLFKIERQQYFAECAAFITLDLNKVVNDKAIYPTELVSVDTAEKTATVRVRFPEEGWREFTGKEGERMEEIGYFLETITKDKAEIVVMYPDSGYSCQLHFRWDHSL